MYSYDVTQLELLPVDADHRLGVDRALVVLGYAVVGPAVGGVEDHDLGPAGHHVRLRTSPHLY